MLDTNFGHRRLCLTLPRLRCLAVSVTHFDRMEEIELEDIVVEDASSLEWLVMHDSKYGPSVRITGPTKLKMLGYLGNGFPIIQLGHTIFKVRSSMHIFPILDKIRCKGYRLIQWTDIS